MSAICSGCYGGRRSGRGSSDRQLVGAIFLIIATLNFLYLFLFGFLLNPSWSSAELLLLLLLLLGLIEGRPASDCIGIATCSRCTGCAIAY